MAEDVITVAGEGLTVSQLVWRRYRKPMPGMVEAILERNRGLAAHVEIPVGTRVVMPDPPAEALAAADVVSLWD